MWCLAVLLLFLFTPSAFADGIQGTNHEPQFQVVNLIEPNGVQEAKSSCEVKVVSGWSSGRKTVFTFPRMDPDTTESFWYGDKHIFDIRCAVNGQAVIVTKVSGNEARLAKLHTPP